MAYFANGSEGAWFENQCSKCKYGNDSCPIELVQYDYNYDACNNKTAKAILDDLISDNGDCAMWKKFKSDFEQSKDK